MERCAGMNDYKELIELLANPTEGRDNADIMIVAADAIKQLIHERFLVGEILVTESKWEIEPETALEQIRRVLRGE